jgi:hypothetical protein
VATVDAQEILLPDAGSTDPFLDGVHPTPPAFALVAQAVAERLVEPLAGLLAPVAEVETGPGTLAIVPDETTTLGDVPVTLRAQGFAWPAEPFVVLVGGAPVLELRRRGLDEWTGLLPANGPGTHELVLQSAQGCRVFPAAVRYHQPELALEGGYLRVRARPGDRVFVFGAPALGSARWTLMGESSFDWSELLDPRVTLWCDGTGSAEKDLAAIAARLPGAAFLQALVVPRGLNLRFGRLSNTIPAPAR